MSAGADPWNVKADVGEVTVRVHYVSKEELRAAARSVGKRSETTELAFSVLRMNVTSGAFTCDVYLLDRPARLQDRPTATLGHEMAHCLGYSHE